MNIFSKCMFLIYSCMHMFHFYFFTLIFNVMSYLDLMLKRVTGDLCWISPVISST